MSNVGIICEYNPFHNGHLYQLNSLNKDDGKICIMSGNYTQRGENAIFDKYSRCEVAIKNGANLVIELPFIYSSASAEMFAKGSINILNSLNIIDDICFGMEDNKRIEEIKHISKILNEEPDIYIFKLKENLNNGLSFAKSRENALLEMLNTDISFITSPNNILAIEYIKQLYKTNSNIDIKPIKRTVGYHENKENDIFLSASEIRRRIQKKQDITLYIPKSEKEYYSPKNAHDNILEKNFDTLKHLILRSNKESLLKYPEMEEGLHNRIYNSIYDKNSLEEFLSFVTTKRYSTSRIRRILLYILTDTTKKLYQSAKKENLEYIKVLGFDEKGRNLLKDIKDNSNLKIFHNYNKDINLLNQTNLDIIKKNIMVDNIYNLNKEEMNLDFYKQSFYLKS